MINANLGIGPMSTEAIEATFRASQELKKELMLIASKNQIDYNRGYVNNWKTEEYMDFVRKMREKYPQNKVLICRDHCGPGFNGIFDLGDTYKTIETDIKCGFDLMHIDFCHYPGTFEERLDESKKAIEYALSLNPKILIEIGTDENDSPNFSKDQLLNALSFFEKFCKPEFYTIPSGSLVKELNQVGTFNRAFMDDVSKILKSKNIKVKEHNADYLSSNEIQKRKFLVDGMNIAPQMGTVQTSTVFKKALMYGIDLSEFFEEVYAGKKWQKWLGHNSPENKMLCFLIAGHYHFSSEKYKRIISQLQEKENIQETIIKEITEVINHYEANR